MITVNSMVNNRNSFFQLDKAERSMFKASENLISGKRINSAKDDPAGFAIASMMSSQIRENNQGIRNANDGISLTQVADGALGGANDILQRMRELALQGSNGTLSADNRETIQSEINQLGEQLTSIGDNTTFNGMSVFSGEQSLNIQVGFNQSISLELTDLTAESLTSGVGTQGDLIKNIDDLSAQISSSRSVLGATQARFISTIDNLSTMSISASASRSRIEDTDYASSISDFLQAGLAKQVSSVVFVKQLEADRSFINQLIKS